MHKFKALLIEDDEGLWPLYSASLKKNNVELISVGSAAAAEKVLKSTHIDLALVDYQLPDATGLSIVERYGDKLTCVLVTAMGDESLAVEAMQKGGKDYLVKDVGWFSPTLKMFSLFPQTLLQEHIICTQYVETLKFKASLSIF